MRMPKESDMSQEQKDIYIDAPLHGKVLVTGPPGTGKTVIAFLRAMTIAKSKKKVSVTMAQNVLKEYSANVADDEFTVSTIHQWWKDWWRNLEIGVDGQNQNEIEMIKVGKKRRDAIKLFGCSGMNKQAVHDLFEIPNNGYSGIFFYWGEKSWCIFKDKYDTNEELFKPYTKARMYIPMMGDKGQDGQFDHDFDEIIDILSEKEEEIQNKLNWGHLIIDESQDFPKEMHQTLKFISHAFFKHDSPGKAPAITIFADENQRLYEDTSTIDEIIQAHNIDSKYQYSLSRNYRNTMEIALLAATFYVGRPTGIPKIPERRGDKPKLRRFNNINDSIQHIYSYAKLHENEEIAIFTEDHRQRKKYCKLISERIDSDGNKNLKVQSYDYNDKDYKDSSKLTFDEGGIISIFTRSMSKGLEFDAVFVVEMQSIPVDPEKIDEFRMNMYVLTSRARNNLTLMLNIDNNQNDIDPQILKYLPEPEKGILEYPDD